MFDQSRRGTDKLSTFKKQGSNVSGGGPLLTSASRETNLVGQGEFGRNLLKVVAKQDRDKSNRIFSYSREDGDGQFQIHDSDLSKPSDFVTGWQRCKTCWLTFSVMLYLGVVTGLKVGLDLYEIKIEDENLKVYFDGLAAFVASNWYYLLYLPIASILLSFLIGRYVLSAIMFPY